MASSFGRGFNPLQLHKVKIFEIQSHKDVFLFMRINLGNYILFDPE